MQKLGLLIKLIVAFLLAVSFSLLSVEWLFGSVVGLLTGYKPPFLLECWQFMAHIYTWAPEDTIISGFFFLIAFVLTIGIPIVAAVYFWKSFLKNLREYKD